MTITPRSFATVAAAALLCSSAWAIAFAGEPGSGIVRMNPPGLSKPQGYSQVVVIPAGYRTVRIAGQGGIDADGKVPADLGAQTRLMFEKIRAALAGAGASARDVVSMTVYVVDLEKTDPSPVYQGIRDFFPADAKPTSTVVGVSALALPAMKVEIEVVAALAPAG